MTTPLDEMVAALDAYQPEVIGGYPSVIALLAEEQLRGRLAIAPRVVLTSSEVLTDDAAREDRGRLDEAGAGLLLDRGGRHRRRLARPRRHARVRGGDRRGRRRREPPGAARDARSKVLLTNLVNHAQPLIRYELSDAVQLEAGRRSRAADRSTGSRGSTAGATTCSGCPARRRRGRRPPVPAARAVRQAPRRPAVPGRPPLDGLLVRIVVRELGSARPRGARRARASSARSRRRAPRLRSRSSSSTAIEREPGHAAKVKLVVSEVPPAA